MFCCLSTLLNDETIGASGGVGSSVLQQVQVRIDDNSNCNQIYGSKAPGGIINSMVCAGYPGRDSCQVSSNNENIIFITNQPFNSTYANASNELIFNQENRTCFI